MRRVQQVRKDVPGEYIFLEVQVTRVRWKRVKMSRMTIDIIVSIQKFDGDSKLVQAMMRNHELDGFLLYHSWRELRKELSRSNR
jgi:hypothetical protein